MVVSRETGRLCTNGREDIERPFRSLNNDHRGLNQSIDEGEIKIEKLNFEIC